MHCLELYIYTYVYVLGFSARTNTNTTRLLYNARQSFDWACNLHLDLYIQSIFNCEVVCVKRRLLQLHGLPDFACCCMNKSDVIFLPAQYDSLL